MGEIVNLRNRRRQLQREQAAQLAADNRARFGLTRGEKDRQEQEKNRQRTALDGARLEHQAPSDETGES